MSAARQSDNLLRLREVLKRVPLGRTTIYRKMAAGHFPAAVPLSFGHDGRPTVVGWYESDVNAYVADPSGWRAPAEEQAGG